ncbi:THO complex subunit 1 [Halotydeus destructor]|nr:THO complex subunit 1 [Halotydeus destructor]
METNSAIQYDSLRKFVLDGLLDSQQSSDSKTILQSCKTLLENASQGTDSDVKSTVDGCFKEVLQKMILENDSSSVDSTVYENFMKKSFDAASNDICSRSLPVTLLTDLFDCTTLSQAEQLFTIVENSVTSLKDPTFFKHVKNQLLRACNDLLKRLSRSQNTVFCGRILVFLAKFFPLFERSGLNLISEFNQENVISIALQDEGEKVANELEDGEMSADKSSDKDVQMNYDLYKKFWKLQEMFRAPATCYNKHTWEQFRTNAKDVLSYFYQHKLDPVVCGSQSKPDSSTVFFSKYLTNQKLLELQFADSNFRRYILVQFLITFQYLTTVVKFKHESHVLSEEQVQWVKETVHKIYKLLDETPPNGRKMRKSIESILDREENWNSWKNDSCPELKPNEVIPPEPSAKRLKPESGQSSDKIQIGSEQLTRLWNICPDNREICRSEQRIFTPSIQKFFEPVFNGSDNERKRLLTDNLFSWRALRLMSQKSPHFFQPSIRMVSSVSSYLELVVDKSSKDLAVEAGSKPTDISIADAEDISDDELLKQVDEMSEEISQPGENGEMEEGEEVKEVKVAVNAAIIESVAHKVGKSWKLLAPMLFKFEDDEIEYFEASSPEVAKQAALMLQVWSEQDEPGKVTTASLQKAIDKCNLEIKVSS